MHHYVHLDADTRDELFSLAPQPVSLLGDAERIGVALGATLYLPGTRSDLAGDVRKQAAHDVMAMVMCLEDSISDADVPWAERNIAATIDDLASVPFDSDDQPALFVRVRTPRQIGELTDLIDAAALRSSVLTGFVMPKFTAENAGEYFHELRTATEKAGRRLLAMPVIESPAVIAPAGRAELLAEIAELLQEHRGMIPCVRIGGTDLCAALGLRRPPELTLYDIGPVASAVRDIIATFGRADGTGFPISGPVWEYFDNAGRLFKPMLRATPFTDVDRPQARERMLEKGLDGLVRELVLDRANGITGKTVIHPQHVGIVHAISVVSTEEYDDARDVLAQHASGGGVTASSYRNKMNEAGPHAAWARRTLMRADAFGVAAPGVDFVDLLLAHTDAVQASKPNYDATKS